MSWIANMLNQTATYWSTPTPDGYGGYSFSTPTSVSCRWENREEIFINSQGVEERSQAVVYLEQDVVEGGYLYLGTSAQGNPKDQAGVWKIKAVKKSPNIAGDTFLRKVWL